MLVPKIYGMGDYLMTYRLTIQESSKFSIHAEARAGVNEFDEGRRRGRLHLTLRTWV